MRFDMSRAWNDAVAMISGNREVVLVVAGLFFFLPYVGLVLAMPDVATMMPTAGSNDPEAARRILTEFYGRIWWMFLLLGLLQGLGTLALMRLLTEHRPTVGEALKFSGTALLPFIGMQLLLGLGLVLVLGLPVLAAIGSGSIAAIVLVCIAALVGPCYLGTKFSLGTAVMAREGVLNPIAVLARSWRLTRRNSIWLFLFYFLIGLVAVIASALSQVFAIIMNMFGPEVGMFGTALLGGLLNGAWVVVFLAVQAAAHDQLAGTSSTAGLNQTFG